MSTKTIVLIHGIRTRAWWQGEVSAIIRKHVDCKVVPLKYDYFDLFRFWCPLGAFRRGPIERLHRELRALIDEQKPNQLFILAHSYGTFSISNILMNDPGIRVDGLVLCGSIVPTDFAWARISTQIKGQPTNSRVINECGVRDIWPPLARSVTWGYGASGTYGFGSSSVRDRVHKTSHSAYFEKAFVEEFWVPFFKDLTIADSGTQDRGEAGPWWFWFFNVPLRWLIVAGLTLGIGFLSQLIYMRFFGFPIAVGAYTCTANGNVLNNCQINKVDGVFRLSFDSFDARPNVLVDNYSGSVVAIGDDLAITLANRFNPNPTRTSEPQQGPSSTLRLSRSGTKFVGSWTFESGTTYSFSISKRGQQ